MSNTWGQGPSTTALQLNPFAAPPLTTAAGAEAEQAAAVGQAAATSAASTAARVAGIEQILTGLGFSFTPDSIALPSWFLGPNGLIATAFGNSTNIWNSVTNYPYFALGSVNSLVAFGGGLLPGAPAPSPALGGALPPPGAIGAWGQRYPPAGPRRARSASCRCHRAGPRTTCRR